MSVNSNDSGRFNQTFLNLFRNAVRKTAPEINLKLPQDNRYRMENILGRGATSIVYKAWDNHLECYVAVKVSNREQNDFIPEARLSGRLNHENIVAIYNSDSTPEMTCIIMEYIDGRSLDAYCSRQNRLTLAKVCEIMIHVCRGLYFAHSKGIVHRDIKPGNIMLTRQGVPKISDFGIAQSDDRTQPMGFAGTPSYMSPEQLKGHPANRVSDIFSLGCVLYELIEGKKAFDSENPYTIIYKVINEKPSPLTILVPAFRELFRRILEKAMAKDPADRYQNCNDLGYDLSRALSRLNSYGKTKKTPVLSSLSGFIRTKAQP